MYKFKLHFRHFTLKTGKKFLLINVNKSVGFTEINTRENGNGKLVILF